MSNEDINLLYTFNLLVSIVSQLCLSTQDTITYIIE